VNNHFHRFLSVMCLVVLGATGFPLFAQQVSQPASPGVVAGTANAQEARGEAVVGYSADQVSVMTQTLADGTTITHKSLSRVYRDSQGRSRYENYGTRADSGGPEDSPQSISIFDPAAGVSYYLNPRDHTAQRHGCANHRLRRARERLTRRPISARRAQPCLDRSVRTSARK